jgi:hypothetical protein
MRIICYMIWMKINLLLASANSIARHRKRVYMDDGSSWSVLYSKYMITRNSIMFFSGCVCHAFWLFMHPTDAQYGIIGGFH